jgi:hypothetical protein
MVDTVNEMIRAEDFAGKSHSCRVTPAKQAPDVAKKS